VPAPFLAIVNPKSGSGRAAKRWPGLEARLRAALAERGELEVVLTSARRHATLLAREAIERGTSTVIAAGGDGTLSEVVAGVLESGGASATQLGLIPLGSGGDFPRSIGLVAGADAAVGVVADGWSRSIDAGRIRNIDAEGKPVASFFVNEASMGISAEVAAAVDRASKFFGGTAAFAYGAVRAIAAFQPSPLRVRVDGEVVFEGGATLVAVANGKYFGGAMRIAPAAELDDSAFEIVVGQRFSKPKLLFRLLPSLYSGGHIGYPGVSVHRGRQVSLEPLEGNTRTVPVEADGELLGQAPVHIEVLPGVLNMLVPRPAP